jgi:RimJ/RimL family protein N-acetyltransferase
MKDAADLHPIFADTQTMRYWSTPPHEHFDQTEEWVRSMVDAPADESDDFIVEVEGRAIGKLGCWRLPEIGFILSRDFAGKGYASEALSAFIAHRRRCGGGEITADTDPGNEPSMRLLKRHGFVETGRAEKTWLIGGRWFDSIYWRLQL